MVLGRFNLSFGGFERWSRSLRTELIEDEDWEEDGEEDEGRGWDMVEWR